MIARVAAEHGRTAQVIVCEGHDLGAAARDALAAGGLIAAGGGDGTVSAVASVVAGSAVPLGVLPMGTLNHFAKDMGIPLDLDSAVRTLFTGVPADVDVGEVNGRVFVNNSSIGLYPQIVRERDREQGRGRGRGRGKWVAFAAAIAQVLRRGVTLHVGVVADRGIETMLDTPFLFVGNNPYSVTGLEIGKRARLDCGTLWLWAAPHANRLTLLGLALGALFGRLSQADLIQHDLQAVQIHTSRRRMHVTIDGEVTLMRTPLRYRVRPGALRVMVPG